MSSPSKSNPRPIVLVTTDVRHMQGFTWHAGIDTYITSLAQVAGLSPLLVPALGKAMVNEDILSAASGLLCTGSRSNVHPRLYGASLSADHEPYDEARDATSLPLIRAAVARGMPLLAICRGHQELNVAYGGTLDTEIQRQQGKMDHRGGPVDDPIDARFAPNHTVSLTPGGRLASLLGPAPITVNSVHRQAIGKLGDGLVSEAVAEDGTIEAISVHEAEGFTLGVQWHPEHWASQDASSDAPSTKIFEAFGDAVRAYAAKGS